MKIKLTLSLAAAALATAALAASAASAADQGAGARLSISAAYDATPVPDASCGGFRVTGVGTASGTQIGEHGTWHDEECANLAASPGSIVIHGNLVLGATAGDEIFISYDVTSPDPDATGAIHPSGTFTVVGGTGRFHDASGGGTLEASGSVVDPATTAQLDGSIRLP
jgi:hypothetical protein